MLWAVAASALVIVACESTSPDGKVPFTTLAPRAPIEAPHGDEHGGGSHDSHAASDGAGAHTADAHEAAHAKGEAHGHGEESAAHASKDEAHADKTAHGGQKAHAVADGAQELGETATGHAEAVGDEAASDAHAAAETVAGTAHAAVEAAEAAAKTADEAVVDTAHAAAEIGSDATEVAAEAVSNTAEPVAKTAEAAVGAGEKAAETIEAAAESAVAPSTAEAPPAVSPALMKKGKKVFTANCVACHQLTGLGLAGAFPPLVASEWVLGDPARPVAIVLQGLMGEIEVKGKKYNNVMAGLGAILKDKDVAAVVTYVRNSWGNSASPVDEALVKKIRAKLKGKGMWKSPAEVTAFAAGL